MKILVVCETGNSASLLLQTKLEKVVPNNAYHNCSVADIGSKEFDIIMTFEDIKNAVVLAAPEGSVVRTIEGLNDFATGAFQKYLEDGSL